jgi:parallel beta-helix repeat protein
MNDSAIRNALKVIGTSHRTLLLTPGSWEVSSSIFIPSNVNLRFEHGACLSIAPSVVVSIDGSMEAPGTNQLFLGKGTVKFSPSFVKEVYPQWWGEVGTPDDTAVCQSALASGASTIRFLPAMYSIDAVGDRREPRGLGLKPFSNTRVIFDPGATLKVIKTDAADYSVILIDGQDNVELQGVVIEGDRNAHTGTGGEWGHGIRIVGSSTNIIVRNCKVSSCWGDGIYIGEGCPDGVYVELCIFDNNRRNACSITDARNVLFKKCTFSNTHGTGPHKGVDVEPNIASDIIQNIVFEDCHSYNNLSHGFSLARDDEQDKPVSVTFRGCVSECDGVGFGIDIGPSDTLGTVFINDCTVLNAKRSGFICTSANLPMKIDGLCIINPNQDKSIGYDQYGPALCSGFAVWSHRPEGSSRRLAGNITARNVSVVSTDGKAMHALCFYNDSNENGGFKNLDIELRTNLSGEKRFYKGEGTYAGFCKVRFSDGPVFDAVKDVGKDSMFSYIGQTITNHGATQDISLSLDHPRTSSFGSEYTIEVVAPHRMTLDFGTPLLLPGASTQCWSAEPGSRLVIRSDGKYWRILEQIGRWDLGNGASPESVGMTSSFNGLVE